MKQRLVCWSNGTILMLVAACAAVSLGQVQSAPAQPAFEVASVKPTGSADGRSLLQAVQGRLIITNLSLRRLLLVAYNLQDYQLTGDPPWADSEHYDIQAKAEGNPSVRDMEGPMLQVLLEDRFKLSIHRDTRQLPVYDLTVEKKGTKLQSSKESSCVPYSADSPPSASAPGEPRPNFCGLHMGYDGSNRTLDGKGVTMTALASTLSRTYLSSLGRNVIDTTGLTGAYDVHLKWRIDSPSAPAGPNMTTTSDETGPSIFSALQEQLGLRLKPAKGPVEVLVVDHVERPSAN
jgi:uncharacterized protein (TIGR03435 family)